MIYNIYNVKLGFFCLLLNYNIDKSRVFLDKNQAYDYLLECKILQIVNIF